MRVIKFMEGQMLINGDYQITITVRGGEVLLDIDLKEYDLTKSPARASIMNEIQETVEDDMRAHSNE